jgi:predicted MFS family arabinose efflux permease
VVESIGWAGFFSLAAITALPGLLLVWHLRPDIIRMAGQQMQRTRN